MTQAVAYYRTSSATNVTGDSLNRQREAVGDYVAAAGYELVREAYDAAIKGTDPIDTRPGFAELLAYCADHDVKAILVENASRFSRDLMIQLTGHHLLKQRGIELIPVDAPTFFTDPTPTAVMIQQILGAVAQFEKAALVAKLKHARDAKRAETGRCGGPQPVPAVVVDLAKVFRSRGLSLREISSELDLEGYTNHNGGAYSASSIKNMLDRP